ncbi:hypothetical protein SLE2022_178620 [Rubroshorea leprosula]
MESVKKLEEKMIENQQKHIFNGCIHAKCIGEGLEVIISEDDSELKKLLEKEIHMKKEAEDEINKLRSQSRQYTEARASGDAEILRLQKVLEDKVHQKKKFEEEIIILSSQPIQLTFEADQMRQRLGREIQGTDRRLQLHLSLNKLNCKKILSLLELDDVNVQIHAVKVVANLAAEELNQARIIEAGGLDSLLMLLSNSNDETILRVAAGAIANLAMNETNQKPILAQGGISLLSITASDADDQQTLHGCWCYCKSVWQWALLGVVRCGHPDVLSQVARGIANFAKCESLASIHTR